MCCRRSRRHASAEGVKREAAMGADVFVRGGGKKDVVARTTMVVERERRASVTRNAAENETTERLPTLT